MVAMICYGNLARMSNEFDKVLNHNAAICSISSPHYLGMVGSRPSSTWDCGEFFLSVSGYSLLHDSGNLGKEYTSPGYLILYLMTFEVQSKVDPRLAGQEHHPWESLSYSPAIAQILGAMDTISVPSKVFELRPILPNLTIFLEEFLCQNHKL